MLVENDFKVRFRTGLLEWYHQNKRDLPWRDTHDPYVIWLSEIILQQTRVTQGLPYFLKFLEHYPDVQSLANATEDEVLRDWEGLGYYTRARNLKKAAELVAHDLQGVFPTKYQELIQLPGIGEYTAAAVSSFSANEARAVVDGNVYRVLARVFDVEDPINANTGKKKFAALANDLLDPIHPGIYNQAMMEFGALHCKPTQPRCSDCFLKFDCKALEVGKVNELPVKLKAKAPRKRFLNYFLIEDAGKFIVRQRGVDDIWAKMYEFPVLETLHGMEKSSSISPVAASSFQEDKSIDAEFLDKLERDWGFLSDVEIVWGPVRHILSHQMIFVRVFRAKIDQPAEEWIVQKGWRFVDFEEFLTLAKPRVIQKFLESKFK